MDSKPSVSDRVLLNFFFPRNSPKGSRGKNKPFICNDKKLFPKAYPRVKKNEIRYIGADENW